jgi:hypothetical protein
MAIPLLRVATTAPLTLVVTVEPEAAGQTLTNQLVVTAPPGSGETTVNDPCPNDPTRSCATTIVAAEVLSPAASSPGPEAHLRGCGRA